MARKGEDEGVSLERHRSTQHEQEENAMSASRATISPSLASQTDTPLAGSADYRQHPSPLTGQEKTAAVARVRWLEHELFEDGHVRRRITRETAQAVVDELNKLRAALGWLEVDLEGRWRWPA
jgi:hypothetical protein